VYRFPVHAVIVGCGRVGAELADALAQRNFSVAIIDKNPAAFEHLHQGFEGKTFVGPAPALITDNRLKLYCLTLAIALPVPNPIGNFVGSVVHEDRLDNGFRGHL